jgi:hypothetical protein
MERRFQRAEVPQTKKKCKIVFKRTGCETRFSEFKSWLPSFAIWWPVAITYPLCALVPHQQNEDNMGIYPRTVMRTELKFTQDWARDVTQWLSTCLASMRPWVPIPNTAKQKFTLTMHSLQKFFNLCLLWRKISEENEEWLDSDPSGPLKCIRT